MTKTNLYVRNGKILLNCFCKNLWNSFAISFSKLEMVFIWLCCLSFLPFARNPLSFSAFQFEIRKLLIFNLFFFIFLLRMERYCLPVVSLGEKWQNWFKASLFGVQMAWFTLQFPHFVEIDQNWLFLKVRYHKICHTFPVFMGHRFFDFG